MRLHFATFGLDDYSITISQRMTIDMKQYLMIDVFFKGEMIARRRRKTDPITQELAEDIINEIKQEQQQTLWIM